jgi:hypothetical protein
MFSSILLFSPELTNKIITSQPFKILISTFMHSSDILSKLTVSLILIPQLLNNYF